MNERGQLNFYDLFLFSIAYKQTEHPEAGIEFHSG